MDSSEWVVRAKYLFKRNLLFMKLCGNIYFYNVNKTFSYSLNNESKILYMGQYQKTNLLNYFLSLGCFDYINNKLNICHLGATKF